MPAPKDMFTPYAYGCQEEALDSLLSFQSAWPAAPVFSHGIEQQYENGVAMLLWFCSY
jgi:hypothetical protein